MLSLTDFIALWSGQKNVGDTDANIGQCTGLIEKWTDNLNLPHTWGNANQLLADADPNFFDIIKNNPQDLNQFPLPGDIPVWDLGVDGHCGVTVDASGKEFHAFEQNNPIGSTPHVVWHDYARVIGWLHPKTAIVATPTPTTSPNLIPLSEDEINALSVLKTHFASSTTKEGQLFGNLEGYANVLTQDAYNLWRNSTQTLASTPTVIITPPIDLPPANLTPVQATGFIAWLKQVFKVG